MSAWFQLLCWLFDGCHGECRGAIRSGCQGEGFQLYFMERINMAGLASYHCWLTVCITCYKHYSLATALHRFRVGTPATVMNFSRSMMSQRVNFSSSTLPAHHYGEQEYSREAFADSRGLHTWNVSNSRSFLNQTVTENKSKVKL